MADFEIFVFILGNLPASKNMFSVLAPASMSVSRLKESIYAKRQKRLKRYDAADLTLLKLKQAIPSAEVDKGMDDLGQTVADEMLPAKKLSYYFPEAPPEDSLHVIMQLPSLPLAGQKHGLSGDDTDGEPAFKRQRTEREETGPTPREKVLSVLHATAWGNPWPRSEDTISKTEICGESGSVDDDDDMDDDMDDDDDDVDNDVDDDVDDPLADKLKVPPHFKYRYFKEIKGLKSALGASADADFQDVLVIREEYEMLRQALEDDLKNYRAFVVTGHPGIGKSTFLFYLLIYRLERKLPTAVQLDAEYYIIFDEQGATVHSLPHRDPRLAKCWALTDSNQDVQHPCAAFAQAERVILASSPKPERWKEWMKQAAGFCIISDLPSVPEIAAIAKELKKRQTQLGEQPYDPSFTLSLVRKWGPSTRNIIRSMKCAALGHVDPIEGNASNAAMDMCQNPSTIFVHSFDKRMAQSQSSSVIFLRRKPRNSVTSGEAQTFIPTPHLLALFEEQRRTMANKDSLKLFFTLSSHALTRGSAGWSHEQKTHERLGTGGEPLSISQGALQMTMQPSARLLPGTLDGLKEADVTGSFYWMPSVANFPGVDGVLGDTDGNVYTIQATIGRDHTSPIEGIKKVWRHFPPDVRTGRTWHFVLIADKKHTADQYMGKLPNEYTLGRARVRVQVWVYALY